MFRTFDPVVLFFILGIVAGLSKSGLKIPRDFYETISIYLLLAIGIKGGIELYHASFGAIIIPGIGTIILGITILLFAFFILSHVCKFDKMNALAIAAHYGSVSAVTFAVTLSYLEQHGIFYEPFVTSLLVLMEVPAVAAAVFLAKLWFHQKDEKLKLAQVFHEVFLGKTILLLLGGLIIGLFIGYSGNQNLNSFFIDLFKGFLALFILEMGIITAERFSDLKKVAFPLLCFAIFMPILSALFGIVMGKIVGLSLGGTIVLATMSASASYIAAPAAMRIAIPEANPTYSITAVLGITFPFNIIVGIILYHWIALRFFF